MSDSSTKRVFSVCATCSVRCPIEVEVENGAVKHIWGNPYLMGGQHLCPRGAAQKATQKDTERVQSPLIRDGERVSGMKKLVAFAEPYTPQWAEQETGVSAKEIITMAHELADAKPAVISIKDCNLRDRMHYRCAPMGVAGPIHSHQA